MGKILSAFVTQTNTPIISVVKQTDQTITADITLNNDTELKGQLSTPNHTYQFTLFVYGTSPAAADIDIALTIPSGTALWMDAGQWSPINGESLIDATAELFLAAAGDELIYVLNGHITITTTGELIFKWAQTTSNAGNTTIHAGSHLIVWQ